MASEDGDTDPPVDDTGGDSGTPSPSTGPSVDIILIKDEINKLKEKLNTDYNTLMRTLRVQLSNYNGVTNTIVSLDALHKSKIDQSVKLVDMIDSGNRDVNTNMRRVVYETDASKPIHNMRILLFVIYVLSSLAFMVIYGRSFTDISSGITRLKIVSVALVLIIFPFFIINIIYSIKYIFTIPDLIYPDTMP